MPKKIIKLTENQLKQIIDNVVQEQVATPEKQGPKLPYKHTQTGEEFRAPYIQKDDDLGVFVNFGSGGILVKSELLKSFGLDLVAMAKQENDAIKNGAQPGKTTNILYILGSLSDLLHVVAKYNIPSASIRAMANQILQKMDEKAINKNYKQYLPLIFNPNENTHIPLQKYWEVASKLVDYQIKQLTSSNEKA